MLNILTALHKLTHQVGVDLDRCSPQPAVLQHTPNAADGYAFSEPTHDATRDHDVLHWLQGAAAAIRSSSTRRTAIAVRVLHGLSLGQWQQKITALRLPQLLALARAFLTGRTTADIDACFDDNKGVWMGPNLNFKICVRVYEGVREFPNASMVSLFDDKSMVLRKREYAKLEFIEVILSGCVIKNAPLITTLLLGFVVARRHLVYLVCRSNNNSTYCSHYDYVRSM